MSACPTPLPKWWGAFERWREAGGLPSERPSSVPRIIPLWAWDCYKERHPKPKPVYDYGLLAGNGWFITNHRSGPVTEKIAAAKASGSKWISPVLDGNNTFTQWDVWRNAANSLGMPVVPWQRMMVAKDIDDLLMVMHAWGAPGAIFNVEQEVETTIKPILLANAVKGVAGSFAVITDYRGYEDQSGFHGPNYSVVADRMTGIMEAFDNTATQAIDVASSLKRLQQMGFKQRTVSPSTKLKPSDYKLAGVTRAPYVLDLVEVKDVPTWA